MMRVAIVGGGPAGATAAEKAARAGLRVTVFEERCGWEKPCGGGLTYKALARYPFLGDSAQPHAAPRRVEFASGRGEEARFRLARPLLIYSRAVLNALLLRRALAAGAELVETRVLDFRREGSAWRIESKAGRYDADFLALAAGARSRLRGIVAPSFAARDFMLTFGHYVPLDESLRARGRDGVVRVQFFEDFEGYAWAFPRPDHLSVGICAKAGESPMPELRRRLEDFALRSGYWRPAAPASERGPVFSHVLAALDVGRWKDARLAGRGWALVGDAAGLADPVTGEGIYFAMRSGELLAEALLAGAPHRYPELIQLDFGWQLALGARLAERFYHGRFLGEFATTRLVQLAARSPSFVRLLDNLIEGSQSYDGLRARVGATFARAAVEIGARWARRACRTWLFRRAPSPRSGESRGTPLAPEDGGQPASIT
jgi:flavin-dependent dehydrogenase